MAKIFNKSTPIPNFPNYEITKDGRVWSFKTNRWLKTRPNKQGYEVAELYNGMGKKKMCKVHTLVLTAFVGPRPKGLECRHLDSNKLNNQLSNLCWDTHTNNTKDQLQLGVHPTQNQYGSNNPLAILTETEVKQIKWLYKYRICTQTKVAKIFDVAKQTISSIVKERNWTHVKLSM